MTRSYMSEAICHIEEFLQKYGDLDKQELNRLTSPHIIRLSKP